ncbi:MAG TPA: AraC family transcriptional regulator [Kofleriaceae bacterium]|nr:AraC family transcriptional regulator [Kofleriaceae bacterium]
MGKLAVAPAHASSPAFPDRPRGHHPVDREDTFGARDCVCHRGARSPRSEGAYPCARIAVMLGGAFQARSQQGSVIVGPGALLLGNAHAGYEYRHLDDGGDRSFEFDCGEPLLEELGRPAFRHAAVPAAASTAHAVALARRALWSGDPEAVREAALAAAAIVVSAERGTPRATIHAAGSQARRIAQALRYIEGHHAGDCSLEVLAAHAGVTSFHFLRTFRAVTGQTPRQVVIATRLRAAATALVTTRRPVLDIALDVGFGDLSHFTASFSRAFGASPGAFRRRERTRR